MPKFLLPILCDIHFDATNPIRGRVQAIADAIVAVDLEVDHFLIVLPGDIVWSGLPEEFDIARSFIHALKDRIKSQRPQAEVSFIATPGNHDCLLSKDAIANRAAKVRNAIPVINNAAPDRYFISDVLTVQENYWAFANSETIALASNLTDKLCNSYLYMKPDMAVQLNLVNTAVLSQHHEDKGGLYVASELAKTAFAIRPQAQVVITLAHHWMGWLDQNNFISLRQALSQRTDMVIIGHQHYTYSYTQTDEMGKGIEFLESPALFDKEQGGSSGFRVLLIDTSELKFKNVNFKWKDKLYRSTPTLTEVPWKKLKVNRSGREYLTLSPEYLNFLSDTGVAYIHSAHEPVALSQLFVYPDLRFKDNGDGTSVDLVRGNKIALSLIDTGISIVEGSALSGKTALSKVLHIDLSSKGGKIVIRLDGRRLDDLTVDQFRKTIVNALPNQYTNADIDKYLQCERTARAVIVDDWHLARLSQTQRYAIYEWINTFTATAVFLVDDSFRMQAIASKVAPNPEIAMALRECTIVGLSQVSVGLLINRWQQLKKGLPSVDAPEISKEIKQLEDLISSRLKKDSLPPYGFFILCMLQAAENKAIDVTVGGSFGHLYEVLVTTALTKGSTHDSLLNQKLALLEEIAFELWQSGKEVVSLKNIDQIAEGFKKAKLIALPVNRLIRDLVETRVLIEAESHYEFAYEHFYLYFLARYLRNHLDEQGTNFKLIVDGMIDNISSSLHSTVVMFLIYFTSERTHIIERLVANASAIYSEVQQARLEKDTEHFVLTEQLSAAPPVDEEPDVAANRAHERERRDREAARDSDKPNSLYKEAFSYAPELSDVRKLHLADKNIEVLGQVIRNFSTTLPGPMKVQVIKASYELGLRAMARIFEIIRAGLDGILQEDGGSEQVRDRSSNELLNEMRSFLLMMAKVVAIRFCAQISSSVGVADMELAYAATLRELDQSSAVRLIDLSIKMEHSSSFPESEVIDVYEKLEERSFGQAVCTFLVAMHLLMYKVHPIVRRRVARKLKLDVQKLEKTIALREPRA